MSGQNDQNPNREYSQVGIALMNIHDEVLLIQEPETAEHISRWRLPYDRLHEGDNLPRYLQSAASVIGTDLTSYDFDTHGICYLGLHQGLCADPSVVVFYAADKPYDISLTDPLDPEKVTARGWFTYEYLLKLNEEGLLCDPELTLAVVKNVQQGLTIPPELITI